MKPSLTTRETRLLTHLRRDGVPVSQPTLMAQMAVFCPELADEAKARRCLSGLEARARILLAHAALDCLVGLHPRRARGARALRGRPGG